MRVLVDRLWPATRSGHRYDRRIEKTNRELTVMTNLEPRVADVKCG